MPGAIGVRRNASGEAVTSVDEAPGGAMRGAYPSCETIRVSSGSRHDAYAPRMPAGEAGQLVDRLPTYGSPREDLCLRDLRDLRDLRGAPRSGAFVV